MSVLRPTIGQVQRVAASLGFNMSAERAAAYLRMMEPTFQSYDIVDRLPDNLPTVTYPRTPGYQVPLEQNPFNAWTRKVSIKGKPGGRLSGKRVVLKDVICLAGVPLSAGTSFLNGFIPEADATVVTRILDAGGEIVGKAQCEYLCESGSSHTSLPAPVLNPRNTEYSAGGSSSGSAALIAAGDADLSLGGDQGGSIRIPAAWCGIVGMKPTYGLIPFTGIFPVDWTLDHAGPMSRNVADNALLLEEVAGPDGLDLRQFGVKTAPYSEVMKQAPTELRIGVVRQSFAAREAQSAVNDKVRLAAERFRALGATVEEMSIDIHAIAGAIQAPTALEGAMDTRIRGNGYGTNHAGLYVPGIVEAMARWRQSAEEIAAPLKVLMMAAEYLSQTYAGRFYGKSQNLIRKLRNSYDQALERYDLLLMPTTPQLPTKLPPAGASEEEIFAVAFNMDANTAPFCATGHPAISVPCGRVGDLPVGLMLIAKHWDEGTIYRAAFAFEQSFDWMTA
jgi:amidase